jgi:hypothetical protein
MIRIRWPARRTLNSTSITGSFRSLKTTKEPTSAFAERQTSFQALPGHEHYPPAATGRVDAIDPMLKISYADRGDLETAR